MKKFILHIGPGKCGSSSIQNFFKVNKNPSSERVRFILLKPKDVLRFNKSELEKSSILEINDLLKINGRNCDILILSRENLYQCPYTISNFFKEALKLFNKNVLIGYSRRQSDFYVSAYSQWFFRSDKSIFETNTILAKLGLNGAYFTGIEKHTMSAIIADFKVEQHFFGDNLMNWYEGYRSIEELLDEKVELKIGTLPKKESKLNLIQDFCLKAGIQLKSSSLSKSNIKINTKFNPSFVEALNVSKEVGHSVFNPHEENNMLTIISEKLKTEIETDTSYFERMMIYTDFYFRRSNQEFCKRYHLDFSYFHAPSDFKKCEIIELFKYKEAKRKSGTWLIDYYKNLSAVMTEVSLSLAKNCIYE